MSPWIEGRCLFPLFDYDDRLGEVIRNARKPAEALRTLQLHLGEKALPNYLLRYVESTSPQGDRSVGVHEPVSIADYSDADELDKAKIERKRGFFGKSQRSKFPDATHHFAIFHNGRGKARVIYKFVGNISFIKNLKHV